MAVRTRIEPLDRSLALVFKEALSPEGRSRALAGFARAQLTEAETINKQALGYVPPHDTFVDGRKGASLESVKPDGTIVFEFELVGDLILWVAEQLTRHSPVRSGRYTASHILFVDGVEVSAFETIPVASIYTFVNTQPYARKIERGLSPQAPDGVFEAIATLAKRRFGNLAQIRFAYREPLAGAVHDWAQKRSGTNKRQLQRDLRQPAIVITPR